MTPHQMAKRECANLLRDGSCLGVRAEDLGHHLGPLTPWSVCAVAERKPCDYFEECVLPLAASRPEYLQCPKDYYRMVQPHDWRHNERPRRPTPTPGTPRPCPDCGKPIGKRRRVCDNCRASRSKESARNRKRLQRVG